MEQKLQDQRSMLQETSEQQLQLSEIQEISEQQLQSLYSPNSNSLQNLGYDIDRQPSSSSFHSIGMVIQEPINQLLQSELVKLRTENQLLIEENQRLKISHGRLLVKSNELSEQYSVVRRENKIQINTINQLIRNNKALNGEVENLKKQNLELRKENQKLGQEVQQLKQKQEKDSKLIQRLQQSVFEADAYRFGAEVLYQIDRLLRKECNWVKDDESLSVVYGRFTGNSLSAQEQKDFDTFLQHHRIDNDVITFSRDFKQDRNYYVHLPQMKRNTLTKQDIRDVFDVACPYYTEALEICLGLLPDLPLQRL